MDRKREKWWQTDESREGGEQEVMRMWINDAPERLEKKKKN